MINVTIVEDNDTIRNGLKEFLKETNNFTCVADYSCCENLLENYFELETDIVLMDINLPGISGIEGIKRLRKLKTKQKIIILTVHAESENIFEALAAGASGYLEKKTPPALMLSLIKDVYNNKSKMNSFIARKIYNFLLSNNSNRINEKPDTNDFIVLKYLTEGNSPAAISDKLNLPVESIYEKLFLLYNKLHEKNETIEERI